MKTTINTFAKGLIADVDTLVLDSQALQYARNIDFISHSGGDQLVLQKRSGYVLTKDYQDNELELPGVVIAAKVLNDICYMVVMNNSLVPEIGTFPSPDYTGGVAGEDVNTTIQKKYSALKNFYNGSGDIFDDQNYNSAFTTSLLNFTTTSEVDIELQPSYDGSVNVILASAENPVRIINSRFSVEEDGVSATLIKRKSKKSNNTYSNEYFYQTELIPRSVVLPDLELEAVETGGKLLGGGYRYYFKYVNADGGETDIIEESRLVSVHEGDSPTSAIGVAGNENTTRSVRFKLSYLDRSYYGIRAYYSHYSGEAAISGAVYSIDKTYLIDEKSECTFVHTGYETSEPIDAATMNVSYSSISKASTITAANNRLLVGNTLYETPNNEDLKALARSLVLDEGTFDIHCHWAVSLDWDNVATYADPVKSYNNTGYWKGETYEIGIRFITDMGISPVYPCHGLDNLSGQGHDGMDNIVIGEELLVFDDNVGQNSDGVYRTSGDMSTYIKRIAGVKYYEGTKLRVNIEQVINSDPSLNIKGFFFVRRRRRKNVIAQGLTVPMATVSSQMQYVAGQDVCTTGTVVGFGIDPKVRPDGDTSEYIKGDVKYVPAPFCCMPFGTETATSSTKNSTDFIVQAPIADLNEFKNYAFYSPDTDCVPALTATTFVGNTHGIEILPQYIDTDFVNDIVNKPPYHISIPTSVHIGYTGYKTATGTKTTGSCTFISTGQNSTASGSMSGLSDRNISIMWHEGEMPYTTRSASNFLHSIQKWFTNTYNYRISYNDTSAPRRPSSAVKYGQYIGINMKSSSMPSAIYDNFNMPMSNGDNQNRVGWISFLGAYNGAGSGVADYVPPEAYGYMTNIFSSENDTHYSLSEWISAYSVNDSSSAYVAISKRFSIDRLKEQGASAYELDLYGGDCIVGTQWKQAWLPAGVPGVPNANDIAAYRDDARKALGLLKYGLVVPVVGQANHNFHLRVPEEVESEAELYGTSRSFHPVRGSDTIRGNRQEETSKYNFGYSAFDYTDNSHFRLNDDAQYYKYSYPNRVYASDTDLTNQFANGYAIFKGLSYKDYNTELGPLTVLHRLGNSAILIFEDGVSVVNVDEKQMVSESGGVYIGGSDALSKSKVISNRVGSMTKYATIASEKYIYGYDIDKDIVWRTNGTDYEDISTMKVQSLIKKIKLAIMDESLIIDMNMSYDVVKGDIYLTFYALSGTNLDITASTCLVYNEVMNIWVCETDDVHSDVFNIGGVNYLTLKNSRNLYEYSNVDSNNVTMYNKFPGVARNVIIASDNDRYVGWEGLYFSEISYVANGDDAQSNKHFNNLFISSTDSMPNRIICNSASTVNYDQLLRPTTNKSYYLGTKVSNYASGFGFAFDLDTPNTFIKPWDGSPLAVGDPITVIFDNESEPFYSYITAMNSGTGANFGKIIRIWVANMSFGNTDLGIIGKLYYGFKSNLRNANASVEGNFTRVQLKGRYVDTPAYVTGSGAKTIYNQYKNIKLMGKTAEINLIYEGGDPIHLKSVTTAYNEYFY